MHIYISKHVQYILHIYIHTHSHKIPSATSFWWPATRTMRLPWAGLSREVKTSLLLCISVAPFSMDRWIVEYLAAGSFCWPNLKECCPWSCPAMVLKKIECRIAGSRNANLHFQWEFIADQFVHLSADVFGIFSYLISPLWARHVMLQENFFKHAIQDRCM